MKRKVIKKIISIVFILVIIGIISALLVSYYYPSYEIDSRTVQMKKMSEKEKNKIIGWLKVQGTTIDLPLVYAESDATIASIDYSFAWSINDTETLSNRAIYLSHNILNVSHKPLISDIEFRDFEPLPAFLYYDFAKKNQFIQYTINGKDYLYRIFSVSIVKEKDIDYEKDAFTKEELKKYINKSRKESYYDYDIKVDENDALLTLVTCTRFYGPTTDYAIKIEARKLRNLERIHPVKVSEKENYKEIKKRMK